MPKLRATAENSGESEMQTGGLRMCANEHNTEQTSTKSSFVVAGRCSGQKLKGQ